MNAFFWSAFIIYDDFWDQDESANPRLLPLANALSRHFNLFYADLFNSKPDYASLYKELSDKIDHTNFWEIASCRFKNSNDGANISPQRVALLEDPESKFLPCAGHIFAPLAIMAELGYKTNSTETISIISFFKHYLAARQLSDDMHDFQEDWRRGHVSLAVNEMINDLSANNSEKERRHIFWTTTIDKLCSKSDLLIEKALTALDKTGIMAKQNKLRELCADLSRSSSKALRDRDELMLFTKKLASS